MKYFYSFFWHYLSILFLIFLDWSGPVRVLKPSYRSPRHCWLQAFAINAGQKTQVATSTNATAIVQDPNNSPPRFTVSTSTAEVSESIERGSLVPGLNMVIDDPDSVSITITRCSPQALKILLSNWLIYMFPSVLWRCSLGGRKGIRPVKNWVVGCWRGYLSGAMCRFAYGPADATATHCLLLRWNPGWFLPFWYRLTWVVPDKGPLNGCVCSCSLAVLDPRVGHTMDVLSPFIPVLCHSDWLFHGESCPRLGVVHPGRSWPSSPSCIWHCSLHYLFLQATPLFPHCVTIVC